VKSTFSDVENDASLEPLTKRGTPTGYPLLVWGPHALDALHVRDRFELETAIDMLHDASIDQPRFLRLWSAAEDQLVAALWDEYNALYVVESHEGYATSMGDSTLRESYVVVLTTPTITYVLPRAVRRRPIASLPLRYSRTNASFTITCAGAPVALRSAKSRPERIGMPIVRKYSGVTTRN
jgi:hypothetical protein